MCAKAFAQRWKDYGQGGTDGAHGQEWLFKFEHLKDFKGETGIGNDYCAYSRLDCVTERSPCLDINCLHNAFLLFGVGWELV